MKSFMNRFMHVASCLAMAMVVMNTQLMCTWIFHQPKLPEAALKFKK